MRYSSLLPFVGLFSFSLASPMGFWEDERDFTTGALEARDDAGLSDRALNPMVKIRQMMRRELVYGEEGAKEMMSLNKRLVWDPTIEYPTGGEVWVSGQQATVNWDTSNIPMAFRGQTGKLVLGYLEDGSVGEHLDLAHPLASDFLYTDGAVNFTVPSVPTKSSYIVILFGDSGNASPKFTIQGTPDDNDDEGDDDDDEYDEDEDEDDDEDDEEDESNSKRELVERLAYSGPKMTKPAAGDAWTAGQQATVTWDATSIPDEVKSGTGQLILGYLDPNSPGEHLNLTSPLAKDFPWSAGSITFTVPSDTQPRTSYIVVLMGDSGNASPQFTINAPAQSKRTIDFRY